MDLLPEEMAVYQFLLALPIEDPVYHPILSPEDLFDAAGVVKKLRGLNFFKKFGEGLQEIFRSNELGESTVRFFLEALRDPTQQRLQFLKVTRVSNTEFECLLSDPVATSIRFKPVDPKV